MLEARAPRWDGAMYLIGASIAGFAASWDGISLQRAWGRIAFSPYLLGALSSFILAVVWRRVSPHIRTRARIVIGVGVLIGAAAVPLTLEIWWRNRDGYHGHVQSEVLVTEESSAALLSGSNPYASSFAMGPLRSWPTGTAEHVPYLPGMFLFGLPRALAGEGAWTDARIAFAIGSVAAAAAALWLARAPPGHALTAAIVLLGLPTGARYMVGGGDDVTVLSLMLLSLVLLQRRHAVGAGLVAGVAAVIKQTAWPLLPFLVIAARDREGRPARARTLAAVSAIVIPTIAPFLVSDAAVFVEDVVLFPLGLTEHQTLAASPTIGRLLASVMPGDVVAGGSLLVVSVVAGVLLLVAPPRDAGGAAVRTALVLTLSVLLAPAGRFGYLLYPIGLFAWARLMLVAEPSPDWMGRTRRSMLSRVSPEPLAARSRGSAGVPEELERREESEHAHGTDEQGQQPEEEPLEEAADREHPGHPIGKQHADLG